jgi:hypothetical protein
MLNKSKLTKQDGAAVGTLVVVLLASFFGN